MRPRPSPSRQARTHRDALHQEHPSLAVVDLSQDRAAILKLGVANDLGQIPASGLISDALICHAMPANYPTRHWPCFVLALMFLKTFP